MRIIEVDSRGVARAVNYEPCLPALCADNGSQERYSPKGVIVTVCILGAFVFGFLCGVGGAGLE